MFLKFDQHIAASFLSIILLAGLLLSACTSGGEMALEEKPIPEDISYNLHIRPILSNNCFSCHGPDANKREAGLRLDLPGDAYKALKENPDAHAIVPEKPKDSEVFRRISSTDGSELMPPPESHLSLTLREIALIEKWILQGAEYEPHWAFIPPEKHPLPAIGQKDWPRNELDYFILEQQEKSGLKPNPEANKEMLLRRLSFDLTGLPPDLALMEGFLADGSEGAYEKIINQLLGEKTYGEKMAVDWMDIARYADSHGYQDDYSMLLTKTCLMTSLSPGNWQVTYSLSRTKSRFWPRDLTGTIKSRKNPEP
jgi:mono/diheme cytochrome c family protein